MLRAVKVVNQLAVKKIVISGDLLSRGEIDSTVIFFSKFRSLIRDSSHSVLLSEVPRLCASVIPQICSSVHNVISRGRRKSAGSSFRRRQRQGEEARRCRSLSRLFSLEFLLFHGLARGILSAVAEKLTEAERSSGI